jgi:hypothetical protein
MTGYYDGCNAVSATLCANTFSALWRPDLKTAPRCVPPPTPENWPWSNVDDRGRTKENSRLAAFGPSSDVLAICNGNWNNLRESLARSAVHRSRRDLRGRVPALQSRRIIASAEDVTAAGRLRMSGKGEACLASAEAAGIPLARDCMRDSIIPGLMTARLRP